VDKVTHSHVCMTERLLSGDPHCDACGDSGFVRIDRISHNGDIREHLVRRDARSKTLCGLSIEESQDACGNRKCRRCIALAIRVSEGPTILEEL